MDPVVTAFCVGDFTGCLELCRDEIEESGLQKMDPESPHWFYYVHSLRWARGKEEALDICTSSSCAYADYLHMSIALPETSDLATAALKTRVADVAKGDSLSDPRLLCLSVYFAALGKVDFATKISSLMSTSLVASLIPIYYALFWRSSQGSNGEIPLPQVPSTHPIYQLMEALTRTMFPSSGMLDGLVPAELMAKEIPTVDNAVEEVGSTLLTTVCRVLLVLIENQRMKWASIIAHHNHGIPAAGRRATMKGRSRRAGGGSRQFKDDDNENENEDDELDRDDDYDEDNENDGEFDPLFEQGCIERETERIARLSEAKTLLVELGKKPWAGQFSSLLTSLNICVCAQMGDNPQSLLLSTISNNTPSSASSISPGSGPSPSGSDHHKK